MTVAEAVASTSQPKEKTKAKQRYLKKKKERKKINKKPSKKAAAQVDSDSDDAVNEAVGSVEDGDGDVEMAEETKQDPAQKKPKKEHRPKKRRKVTDEEDNNLDEEGDVTMPLEEPLAEAEDVQPPPRRSPTPQAALPVFPLPALPDAPSKSVLALQGLDKALVDAEIVDPATTLPVPPEGEADHVTGLSEKTRKRLHELGITELFAVQTTLLPFLLPKDPLQRQLYVPYNPPRDVCVSAPTGSGKTLAYVLPIIEILSSRIVTRLRALIVLPTRDLVTQVRETFEAVGRGRGLKIGTATGQHSFSHEQSQLVTDKTTVLQGGSSKVDILICTPGRLMDHLNETPNFSLQHLRFLVIDEADRLLAQSFQDWLAQVLAATRPPKATQAYDLSSEPSSPSPSSSSHMNSIPHHDALAPAFLPTTYIDADISSYVPEKKETSCQKLLFSATLTREPDKIAALDLRDPKYFVIQSPSKDKDAANAELGGVSDLVMEKFSMPASLSEHMIVCESSQKPLMFFHLVHKHGVTNALVFTKSTESATRLVRLFDFFERARTSGSPDSSKGIVVRAYSSDLGVGERKSILEKFKAQEIQILVCSDLISRGMDISHVSHVVSYDVPVDMRKYVHRVGRTARAGRSGDAWTLVEEQEARYFKSMLKEAGHIDAVKRLRVGEQDLEPLVLHYESALKQLRDVYARS